MAKKKKKPSDQQKLKLVRSQSRNEFFAKLESVFNILCGENIYQLIPVEIHDLLYEIRAHPLTIIADKDSKIPGSVLKQMKLWLKNQLNGTLLDLTPNGPKIKLHDFFSIVFSFIVLRHRIQNDSFTNAETIKSAMEQFNYDDLLNEVFIKHLYPMFYDLGFSKSDVSKYLYWFDIVLLEKKGSDFVVENKAYLHRKLAKTISVEIKGIKRPVVPFEWGTPYNGLVSVSVNPSELNINSPLAEMPMQVYIQSHAIRRLSERIDNLELGVTHYFMYRSFKEVKVFYDTNNKMLIEYRISDSKAGYFRVDMVDGMLVVRTFLFITNNTTPEGQLLEKNTGLKKLDKKYLAIDKLSTFMSSDIGNNEVIRKIFDESGCHSLIELYKKMDEFSIKRSNQSTAKLMLDYLGYDNV